MIRESLDWWVLERSSSHDLLILLVGKMRPRDSVPCPGLHSKWATGPDAMSVSWRALRVFFNDYYFVKDKLSKKGKEKKKSHMKHLFWVQAFSIMVLLKPKKNIARLVTVPFHPRGNWVPERPSLRATQLSNRAGTWGTPACDHKGFSFKRTTLPGGRKSHWQQDWISSHTKSPGEESRASL